MPDFSFEVAFEKKMRELVEYVRAQPNPDWLTEILMACLETEKRAFVDAGVELGYFRLSYGEATGELVYDATSKWVEVSEDQASRVISDYLRG